MLSYKDIMMFASLKDRDLKKEGIIIGEGRFLTERIVTYCNPLGVLTVHSAEEYAKKIVDNRCPVWGLDEQEIASLVGYKFHRGMIIAAQRKEIPHFDIKYYEQCDAYKRLVVCADIKDPENLGLIIRNAAALGWDGLLITEHCADVFNRKTLRASMGAVFSIPLFYIATKQLEIFKQNDWKIVASALNAHAQSPELLHAIEKLVLILGNEAYGITEDIQKQCDMLVQIPQVKNNAIDSFNVSSAAAILLWEGRIKHNNEKLC